MIHRMAILAGAATSFALGHSLVHAATLEGTHREGLIKGCVQTYATMPAPPPALAAKIPALKYRSDAAKLREYCACHADASFAPVQQSDYLAYLKEIRSGVQGPAFQKVGTQISQQAKVADRDCDLKLSGAGK